MPEHDSHHVDHGYERRDFIERRGVVGFVLTLGLSVVAVFVICVFLLQKMESEAAPEGSEPGTSVPVSAGPRLQPYPVSEMDPFKKRTEAHLEEYGWHDRAAGIARIPIEKAMEVVAGENLPSRDGGGK